MKTKAQIRAKLAKVEQDERLHYEPALVLINAPLALIQVNLRTISDELRWVLDEPPLPMPKKKKPKTPRPRQRGRGGKRKS